MIINKHMIKITVIKHLLLTILITGFLVGCSRRSTTSEDLTHLVDPMIGTDWVGNVYPGVSAPFGMVQLSPDNGLAGWDRIAGYYYPDSTIAGFSHTHLSGTGAGDMYDISFMPILLPGEIDTLYRVSPQGEELAPIGIYSRFAHNREEARAGYYSVYLDSYDIKVELTASERVGIQRYTFERASDSACVLINLTKAMNWDNTVRGHIEQVDSLTLMGYRFSHGWAQDQRVYFRSRFSRRPDSIALVPSESFSEGEPVVSYDARLYYRVEAGDQLIIATALSGVDELGATQNLESEAAHLDFDRHLKVNARRWHSRLSSIELADDGTETEAERTKLYTALYRVQLCPTLYSDVDGRYLGADRHIHQLPETEKHYSTFSLWDTYRAAHPLYNILYPQDNRQMVQSLIDFGSQNSGHLPVWNMWAGETDMMIGYHSVPVIIEAVLKGVYQPKDYTLLSSLLRSTAERSHYRGLDEYRRLGYVPADKEEESLSKTIEYSYDDAAIAAYMRYIGDSTLAREYERRANSYQMLWDSTTRFLRPRLSSGVWSEPFSAFAYTKDVTESNAYQYLFGAHHAIDDMVRLMGGIDSLSVRLDRFFSDGTPDDIALPIFSTGMIGQYAHGNEPSHHAIFLYNIARQPWRTAELTRRVCLELYTERPDGICGNEDCGQMSAWYIFATLGFYPLDPISGKYELTAPILEGYRINLPNGKVFSVRAQGCKMKPYIKSVALNGVPLKTSYITYDQIMSGGELQFEMTNEAEHIWY